MNDDNWNRIEDHLDAARALLAQRKTTDATDAAAQPAFDAWPEYPADWPSTTEILREAYERWPDRKISLLGVYQDEDRSVYGLVLVRSDHYFLPDSIDTSVRSEHPGGWQMSWTPAARVREVAL